MTLEEIRKEIDAIDEALIPLLEKRLKLVSALLDKKLTLTDPKREKEILSKISSPYIRAIYKTLFAQSKALLQARGFQQ